MTGRPGWAVLMAMCSGLALVGCGGAFGGGTLSQQVGSWSTSTGFPSMLARVRGDLALIAAASGAPARRTACDVLVTDALAANEQLPTPDERLTSLLSSAYARAAAAGHDCFHGAAGDGSLSAGAAGERTAALTGLVRAEARYDELTSAVPGGAR